MDTVGLGVITLKFKLDGLTDEQIENISDAYIKIIEPDGNSVVLKADVNKKEKTLTVKYTVKKKGIHSVSGKIFFKDMTYTTSYNKYEFFAQSFWE